MVEGPSLPPPAPSFQPTSHNPNSPDTAKVASRETNRHQLRTTLRRNCPVSLRSARVRIIQQTFKTKAAPHPRSRGQAQQVHVPKTWPEDLAERLDSTLPSEDSALLLNDGIPSSPHPTQLCNQADARPRVYRKKRDRQRHSSV